MFRVFRHCIIVFIRRLPFSLQTVITHTSLCYSAAYNKLFSPSVSQFPQEKWLNSSITFYSVFISHFSWRFEDLRLSKTNKFLLLSLANFFAAPVTSPQTKSEQRHCPRNKAPSLKKSSLINAAHRVAYSNFPRAIIYYQIKHAVNILKNVDDRELY